MRYILVGIGLIYVAIRYGLMVPYEKRNPMLAGVVGVILCILMIVAGLALLVWGW